VRVRRRGECPAEAGEFAGDGDRDDGASVAALLGQPTPDHAGDVAPARRSRSRWVGRRPRRCSVTLAGGCLAVVPSGFDEQPAGVLEPGLGDLACRRVSRSLIARDQPEVAHQPCPTDRTGQSRRSRWPSRPRTACRSRVGTAGERWCARTTRVGRLGVRPLEVAAAAPERVGRARYIQQASPVRRRGDRGRAARSGAGRPRARGVVVDDAVTQQQLAQPLPGAHQIPAQIFASGHRIPQRLLLLDRRYPHRCSASIINSGSTRSASRRSVLIRSWDGRSMFPGAAMPHTIPAASSALASPYPVAPPHTPRTFSPYPPGRPLSCRCPCRRLAPPHTPRAFGRAAPRTAPRPSPRRPAPCTSESRQTRRRTSRRPRFARACPDPPSCEPVPGRPPKRLWVPAARVASAAAKAHTRAGARRLRQQSGRQPPMV
jgi:hypothetical protein